MEGLVARSGGAQRFIDNFVRFPTRNRLALDIDPSKVLLQSAHDLAPAFGRDGRRLRQDPDTYLLLLGNGAAKQTFDGKTLLR